MDSTIISVFGTGRAQPDEPVYVLAEQVGRTLARAGFAIANGGYGGTMEASAKGAAGAGGIVIGVTCSAFGSSVANEYVTRRVVTSSLNERLQNLIKDKREQFRQFVDRVHAFDDLIKGTQSVLW